MGVTHEVVRQTMIQDIHTLIQVKNSFRTKFQSLMTNIIKIALQKGEEKLACVMVAYYEISLEETMIIRALANNNF